MTNAEISAAVRLLRDLQRLTAEERADFYIRLRAIPSLTRLERTAIWALAQVGTGRNHEAEKASQLWQKEFEDDGSQKAQG